MRKILLIAAAIVSLSGGARADIMDRELSSAPQLGCQLNAVTFANQDFGTLQQARNECNRLLQLVGDTNTQDCRALTLEDQDGNIFRRAELRVQNQVQGLTLQQALQQLTLLVLNNALLGDPALQIQVATQGSCAQ